MSGRTKTPRPSATARLAIALRALWLFLQVRARLRSTALPLVVASLGRVDRPRRPRARPRRLGTIVARTLAIGPFRARCLHTSLVLYRMLREQGDRAELVIGLEPNPRDKDAHAWIEVDGRDVGPPPGGAGFTALARYGADAADVVEVLVSCLRDPLGATEAVEAILADGRGEHLLEASRRQGVEPLVAPLLLQMSSLDQDTRTEVQGRSATRGAHQLRVLQDLAWIDDRLRGAGISWLAFKGPVIAALLYDPPTSRRYNDLDVWVPRAAFPDAIHALEADGAPVLDANWPLIHREGRGQLHLRLPMGTVADIHWHLLNRRIVRDSFAVPMDELLDHARTVDVEGHRVATLDPADTLIHLALHAALNGADRLSLLEDVRRSIALERPPWDEVVGRADAWRAGPSVAVTLRRARDLLGADVPDDVLRRLDRSALRRSFGVYLDRRWPALEPHRRWGLAVLWPQLVRQGAWSTAMTAAARAVRPISGRVRQLTGEPGREPDSRAVFVASGAEEERRRFMAAVAEGSL
jgi:Uncharacterised nucleotidyltransferase/Transglutaminase-like superfamily